MAIARKPNSKPKPPVTDDAADAALEQKILEIGEGTSEVQRNILAEQMLGLADSPLMVIFMISVLYLILGCFMETLSMMIATTAVVVPESRDRATGAVRLANAGANIIVQDAESSVVWGMPGAVAKAGLANAILPPAHICRLLARSAKQ